MMTKIHWLQNPNKNYLGHQDLPNGQDVILTIKSVAWESVKNPILNTSSEKRVIRFIEQDKWIKPFICNETNAKTIMKVTNSKFVDDSFNKKIKIGISKTKVKKEEVDCLRVRDINSNDLVSCITNAQIAQIQDLLPKANKTAQDICSAFKINSLKELPISKFDNIMKKLNDYANN